MKVDGVLRVSGQVAVYSGFFGGGLGGSIYINIYYFDGFGQVQVDKNINMFDVQIFFIEMVNFRWIFQR